MVPKVPDDTSGGGAGGGAGGGPEGGSGGGSGDGDPGMETPLAPMPELDAVLGPDVDLGTRPTKGTAPKKSRPRRGKKSRAPARKPGAASAGRGPVGAGWAYAGRISLRVLVFVVLVQLLLGVTVVLPFASAVGEKLDAHPHAAAIAGDPSPEDAALGWRAGLDPGIWSDTRRELGDLLGGLTFVHFWVALVAWLFGAVAAGGFLGTYVAGENPVRVGAFLGQGAKYFGRMLRVGLLFALAYYVTARLVFEVWGGSVQSTEFESASETAGWWGGRIRELVMVLCFLWFRVAGDLARADLVVYGRTGAVAAWFRGLVGALRPRTMLTALAFGVPAFVLLVGLGFAARALTGDETHTVIVLFLLFQLAVGVRWAARAGVLAAFAHAKQ